MTNPVIRINVQYDSKLWDNGRAIRRVLAVQYSEESTTLKRDHATHNYSSVMTPIFCTGIMSAVYNFQHVLA